MSSLVAWVVVAAVSAAPLDGGVRDSDDRANAFLSALQAGDYERATAGFDDLLHAQLPADSLAAVWRGQLAKLGALRGWEISQRDRLDSRDIRIAVLRCEEGQLRATIRIDQESLRMTGVTFAPVAPPGKSPPYAVASRFRQESVYVGAAPFVLGGTLTLPVGAGPFAAAVLVHGSGPNDRDESIGANKPFRDIAEGLASRGIAVLRYDKRTFQYFYRLKAISNIDDEVVFDAVDALKLLRGRPEIDPQRIYVVGHSLGAMLAPEIALRGAPVAGAALLAPPGRPPWDCIIEQMRYLDAPAEDIAAAEKAVALLKAGKLGNGVLLGAPGWYWEDWGRRDGVASAKKLGRPLLILHGLRDYQVTRDDLAIWNKGLAGVAGVAFQTFAKDNHLFIPGTGKPTATEYERAGHVDARVIDSLAIFLARKP